MSWHVGRSWFGHEIEDACPCPKTSCGLVDLANTDPECVQHPVERMKTIRQGHREDDCPGLKR
jgi:hypothetical protein